jgi:membrane dipeptidase
MRLIDLHVDWLLQYAPETTVFNPDLYSGVAGRTGQLSGYLQSTRAAILSCYRRAEEWATLADPWAALGDLIARIEAEFPGRLLIGPDDFDRWQDDRDGLAWGVIGVEGFDALVRSADDLPKLPKLFDRGVRLFQPIYGLNNFLGGSSAQGDDRGLTDLGSAFLGVLANSSAGASGPRPMLDVAHTNPRTMADILNWYEADPSRAQALPPVYSHGAPARPDYDSPRAITLDNLRKLRGLGGFVGIGVSPPFYQSAVQVEEAIRAVASIPYLGREGFEGIGIGTDFMGVDQTLPSLENAGEVVVWLQERFDRPTARALTSGNALGLISTSLGLNRQAP